ncbi:MAG: sugar ABC transporter substrate-binding protein [Spirochaetaceae bacterium]|nr:MAG: sugar ABC transporter substrate-binding protein [Spirochaetaceae bacterium]
MGIGRSAKTWPLRLPSCLMSPLRSFSDITTAWNLTRLHPIESGADFVVCLCLSGLLGAKGAFRRPNNKIGTSSKGQHVDVDQTDLSSLAKLPRPESNGRSAAAVAATGVDRDTGGQKRVTNRESCYTLLVMRNRQSVALACSLICIVCSGVLLLLSFGRSIHEVMAAETEALIVETHLTVILPDNSDSFFRSVASGGRSEAVFQQVALEFLYYNSDREVGLLLRQARWMQTDGVLIYLPEQNSFKHEINQLESSGIPVVTLIHDTPLSERRAHLGFDDEGIARELVRMIGIGAEQDTQTWALLIGADSEGQPTWGGTRIAAVVRSMLSSYGGVELLSERAIVHGYFSGEQASVRLLREHPDLGGIIVAVPQTLGGVVQALIDQHRLGSIGVVGIDFGAGVEQALTRGLLDGTISRHPEQIGVQGVRTLIHAVRGEYIAEYHDLAYSAVEPTRGTSWQE